MGVKDQVFGDALFLKSDFCHAELLRKSLRIKRSIGALIDPPSVIDPVGAEQYDHKLAQAHKIGIKLIFFGKPESKNNANNQQKRCYKRAKNINNTEFFS